MGMHTQLTFECSPPSNKFQFEQTSSSDLNKNQALIWVNIESQLLCWMNDVYWTPRFRYNLTLTSHKKTCTLGLCDSWCWLNSGEVTWVLSLFWLWQRWSFLMSFLWFFLVNRKKIPFVMHQPHIQVRKIVNFGYYKKS